MPLHKKKDNYSGVALLSVPGKVLALILLEDYRPSMSPSFWKTSVVFGGGVVLWIRFG